MRTPETEKDFSWEAPYGYLIELPRGVSGRALAPILRDRLSHLLYLYDPETSDPKADDRIIYTFTIAESAFMRQYLCGRPLALAIREVLYADMMYGSLRVAISCWRFRTLSFGSAWRPVPLNDDNLTLKAICDNLRDLINPPIRWAQTRNE
ncbi:MAG: hypothetical protein Greene071436_392 [Parcubacteria group bacterium Greene0714_36]|nr:MAG: hypothetical protein Greene071436_392 [Parcubacteria group bacterium Greene0714_36]